VTEQDWLSCAYPEAMLRSLQGRVSDRKLRLFGCACCRRIWAQLPRDANRALVAAVEDWPDGTFDDPPLHAAIVASSRDEHACAHDPGYWAVKYLGRSFYKAPPSAAVPVVLWRVRQQVGPEHNPVAALRGAGGAEARAQCALLHDILGPLPFRPVALDPAWWTPAVAALAAAGYADRRFDGLPVLADALEEAGCADAAILGHLRGPGPHVRGCWVLDLVLGKE
jgi:hypothetical protein